MRLNGRRAILRYLGKSPHSTRAWRGVLLRYGSAIRVMYPRGHRAIRGYWCRSEELDRIDADLSPTAWDVFGKANLVAQVATRRSLLENARLSRVGGR